MVNFSKLQFDDRAPVYLQIAKYLKRQILLGTVQDGDPMPSRRELAAQTGLPVRCTLVREELYPALKGRLPAPFPVKILVRQPWQKELPRQGQE